MATITITTGGLPLGSLLFASQSPLLATGIMIVFAPLRIPPSSLLSGLESQLGNNSIPSGLTRQHSIPRKDSTFVESPLVGDVVKRNQTIKSETALSPLASVGDNRRSTTLLSRNSRQVLLIDKMQRHTLPACPTPRFTAFTKKTRGRTQMVCK